MSTYQNESERLDHNAARILLRRFRSQSWRDVEMKLDEFDAEGVLHFEDRDALRRYASAARRAYTPADQTHVELLAYRRLIPYLLHVDEEL